MVLTFEEATTPVQVLEVAARKVLSLGTLVKCLLQPNARNNPEVAKLRSAVQGLQQVFQRWCKDGCNCRMIIATAKLEMLELTTRLLELAESLISTTHSHGHVKGEAEGIRSALAMVA